MSATVPSQHPKTAISETFPPQWTLGQEWRVVCTTEVAKADIPLPDPALFGDAVFQFRVTEVPNEKHAHYRVDASMEDSKSTYALYFRASPFSLARSELRYKDGLLDWTEYRTTPAVGKTIHRLIVDFPVMPPPDRIFSPAQFEIDDKSFSQTIEPTSDGVRITLESESYRIFFLWKKGQPWWSSVERSYTPRFRDNVDRTFAGSGRLLP